MEITGNEPVHPITDAQGNEYASGMTIRQHFAGLAMQALITSEPERKVSYIVKDAVEIADALIAELNKELKP